MNVCPQCGIEFDDSIELCSVDHLKLISIGPTDDAPMLGKLLDGRYRLIRKVGEGGMGSIYRAVHTEMSRTCAIKLLTALSPGKDDAIARFKREAKNSSRIDNVHAVTIYDFGESDDGMLFLAMEFIDGTPLSRVMAEQRTLPIERVIHLTEQIAEALAAAHALGIVHRDLKPDNIMITRKGAETDFVKVLDFGIAKTIADEGGDNLTKTGFVLGTPVYMSPEQLLGEKLDGRSDVYSLAIIVYEMLSGRLPFDGDNPQAVMMKRVMSDPIRLRVVAPSVSESVERVVMAGLRRDRDARTPDAETFATELGRALYTGTQIMGGVVTRKLTEPGVARATHDHTGVWVSHESSVALSPEPEPASDSSFPNVPAFAATEVSFPPVAPAVVERPSSSHQATPSAIALTTDPVVVSKPRRGKWVLGGGVLAIAVIALIVYLILPFGSASGFTLVVKGAPAGSLVFINEVSRNAETTNGDLRISGVAPGQITVRVSHEGFADFIGTLTAVKGQTQTCVAQLLPEIEYGGGGMIPIPAGEFLMGDDNHDADEKPAHRVSLPSYYIDKYEVTNALYKRFCDATHTAYPDNPPFDPKYFQTKPEHPVLGVTIDQARSYASWAGKRLPTEEEWEKAAAWDAVAQKKRQYPWGDDFDAGHANIGTDHPNAVTEPNGDRSQYGVLNMAGNAAEWADALYKPYKGNETPDPDYAKNDYVMRGGTFSRASTQVESRSAYRNHLPRVFFKDKAVPVGIRCVVTADDPRIQQLIRERSK